MTFASIRKVALGILTATVLTQSLLSTAHADDLAVLRKSDAQFEAEILAESQRVRRLGVRAALVSTAAVTTPLAAVGCTAGWLMLEGLNVFVCPVLAGAAASSSWAAYRNLVDPVYYASLNLQDADTAQFQKTESFEVMARELGKKQAKALAAELVTRPGKTGHLELQAQIDPKLYPVTSSLLAEISASRNSDDRSLAEILDSVRNQLYRRR